MLADLVKATERTRLVVQARVDNQDVGFVKAGQEAEVKVETFPFTRYGLIHGTVLDVGRDVVAAGEGSAGKSGSEGGKAGGTPAKGDEMPPRTDTGGYVAHVALGRTEMMTEGGPVPLGPGMAMTAEIKTGRRSVISYLLSPLQRYVDEGMKER